MEQTRYLSRADAGEYLKTKYGFAPARSLARLASIGGGPIFRKVGIRTFYVPADLDAWAESKLSKPLTLSSEFERK